MVFILQTAVDDALNKAVADAVAPKNTEIAQLKARITELESGAGPVDPPPVDPPVEPPPVVPPPAGTFNPRTMSVAQIAAATGLKDASVLKKSGGVNITKAGTYENMDYTGRVTINCPGDVLFRNCRFNPGGDYYGVINNGDGKVRLEFCEARNAQNCIAGKNIYIYRCELSEWENAVNFWGGGEIVESYVYGEKGSADAHFDAIEINGGGNLKILRNYVTNGKGQTSAVMLAAYFGDLHDIEIDGNYLAGGGYTIYVDKGTNIKVTNNTLKKGQWGWTALYNGQNLKIDATTGNVLLP